MEAVGESDRIGSRTRELRQTGLVSGTFRRKIYPLWGIREGVTSKRGVRAQMPEDMAQGQANRQWLTWGGGAQV